MIQFMGINKMKIFARIIFIKFLLLVHITNSFGMTNAELNVIEKVNKILSQQEHKIDLLDSRLQIEKIIDPSINTQAIKNKINKIVKKINSQLTDDMSLVNIILLINKILYSSGPWNNFNPYKYDFDDPMGTKISNKLIANYIFSKRGNCVSMPLLYVIVANKLGIEATITVAPLHYFVKIKNYIQGGYYNIESTYNGQISLEKSYIEKYNIRPIAIDNGVYLKPLGKNEIIAVMVNTLSDYFASQQKWELSIAVAMQTLTNYSNNVYAMVKIGNGYYKLLEELENRNKSNITANEKEYMVSLYKKNIYWLAKAEQLGLQMPSAQQNKEYLESIEANKSH